MVAEVVHGAPCRFPDPARFSLAHGGKDRHPYPVPLKVYDETVRVLKSAVQKAKLGRDEELGLLLRRWKDAARAANSSCAHTAGAVMPSDCENAVPVCAENAPPGTTGATAVEVDDVVSLTSVSSSALALGVPQPVTVSKPVPVVQVAQEPSLPATMSAKSAA